MAAPYRTAEPPDDSAERAELAAFERKVTVLPRWLRVGSESRSSDLILPIVAVQLTILFVIGAPLREALLLPVVMMAVPSLLALAGRIRERRRRR